MENKNLVKAILSVMDEVKNIDKNSKVWVGYNSYKGVNDKDVKLAIGGAMKKHWLVLLPIDIEEEVETTSFEEEYQGKTKLKTSRFTKVKVTYELIHESGESKKIIWYWHGVDSQDKWAGKATTYALKYALLYTFLTPTWDIDDTDNTHSEDIKTPEEKPKFTTERLDKMKEWAKDKKKAEVMTQLETIKKDFEISEIMKKELDLFVKTIK